MAASLCRPVFAGTSLRDTASQHGYTSSFRSLSKKDLMKVTCRGGSTRQSRMYREEQNRPEGPLMNEEIRVPTVRLLDENQVMIGTCTRMEALTRARAAGLDLVMVSGDASPPVVRIVDYKKFLFDQQKRKKEQQKKASANRSETKELKMRYNIDTHDYEVKTRAAQSFLTDGHRVKLVVTFRGREMEFRDMGLELLSKFVKDVGEVGISDSRPSSEGRAIVLQISPNKVVISKMKAAKAALGGEAEGQPDEEKEEAVEEEEEEEEEEEDGEGENTADSESLVSAN